MILLQKFHFFFLVLDYRSIYHGRIQFPLMEGSVHSDEASSENCRQGIVPIRIEYNSKSISTFQSGSMSWKNFSIQFMVHGLGLAKLVVQTMKTPLFSSGTSFYCSWNWSSYGKAPWLLMFLTQSVYLCLPCDYPTLKLPTQHRHEPEFAYLAEPKADEHKSNLNDCDRIDRLKPVLVLFLLAQTVRHRMNHTRFFYNSSLWMEDKDNARHPAQPNLACYYSQAFNFSVIFHDSNPIASLLPSQIARGAQHKAVYIKRFESQNCKTQMEGTWFRPCSLYLSSKNFKWLKISSEISQKEKEKEEGGKRKSC